jgi:hypothetical protein
MNNDISKLRMRLDEIRNKILKNEYDGLFISIPQNVRQVLTGTSNSDFLNNVHGNSLAIESGISDVPGYLLITKDRAIFATYWYQFYLAHIEVLNRPNISISSIGMTIDESINTKGKQEFPLVDIISISLDVKWLIDVFNQSRITFLKWDGSFTSKNSWMSKNLLEELIRIQNQRKIFISPGLNFSELEFEKFS